MPKEIDEYVKKTILLGYTKKQITQALVLSGWSRKEIDRSFNRYYHPKNTNWGLIGGIFAVLLVGVGLFVYFGGFLNSTEVLYPATVDNYNDSYEDIFTENDSLFDDENITNTTGVPSLPPMNLLDCGSYNYVENVTTENTDCFCKGVFNNQKTMLSFEMEDSLILEYDGNATIVYYTNSRDVISGVCDVTTIFPTQLYTKNDCLMNVVLPMVSILMEDNGTNCAGSMVES